MHRRLIVDDLGLVLRAALDDVGLAYMSEDNAAPHVASWALDRVWKIGANHFPASSFFIRAGASNRRLCRQ